MKRCVKCKEERPDSDYQMSRVSPRGTVYYKSRCRHCVGVERRTRRAVNPESRARAIAREKEWRRQNPELYERLRTNWTLRHKYGIDADDYDRILASQGGVCAICGSDKSFSKGYGRFHVDHCHRTHKIRGLLCQGCNTTLGQMRDSPELLRRAADYLELHATVVKAA